MQPRFLIRRIALVLFLATANPCFNTIQVPAYNQTVQRFLDTSDRMQDQAVAAWLELGRRPLFKRRSDGFERLLQTVFLRTGRGTTEDMMARPSGTEEVPPELIQQLTDAWYSRERLHYFDWGSVATVWNLENLRAREEERIVVGKGASYSSASEEFEKARGLLLMEAQKEWDRVLRAINERRIGPYQLEMVGVETADRDYLVPADPSKNIPEIRVLGRVLNPGDQGVRVPTLRIYAPRAQVLGEGRADPALVESCWHEIAVHDPAGPREHWIVVAYETVLFKQDTVFGGGHPITLRQSAELVRAVERGDEPYLRWLAEHDYSFHPEEEARKLQHPGAYGVAFYSSLYLAVAASEALRTLQRQRALNRGPLFPRLSERDQTWLLALLERHGVTFEEESIRTRTLDLLAKLMWEPPTSRHVDALEQQAIEEFRKLEPTIELSKLQALIREVLSPYRSQLTEQEQTVLREIIAAMPKDRAPDTTWHQLPELIAWEYLRDGTPCWVGWRTSRGLTSLGVTDLYIRDKMLVYVTLFRDTGQGFDVKSLNYQIRIRPRTNTDEGERTDKLGDLLNRLSQPHTFMTFRDIQAQLKYSKPNVWKWIRALKKNGILGTVLVRSSLTRARVRYHLSPQAREAIVTSGVQVFIATRNPFLKHAA